MNPTLKLSSSNDYKKLVSWITSAEDCLLWAGPSISFPVSVESLKESLIGKETINFSYMREKDLIGFGQVWPRLSTSSHIGRVIINPKERRKGFGKELVQLLVLEAKKAFDYSFVTLKVYRSNKYALKTYLDIGFEEVPCDSDKESMLMKQDAPGDVD